MKSRSLLYTLALVAAAGLSPGSLEATITNVPTEDPNVLADGVTGSWPLQP